jgi:uncharacterized membrane protein
MRHHLWMHAGLLAAILTVFGLSALGVTVPTAVVYLIVLACPLMMISMMFTHDHDHKAHEPARDSSADASRPAHR